MNKIFIVLFSFVVFLSVTLTVVSCVSQGSTTWDMMIEKKDNYNN